MGKRVLIISTVGLIYDGITSVIISYLKAMDRCGLDVYVAATIKTESEIRCSLQEMGCKIIDFPSRRTETISYLFALSKFIRKNGIQVVHAHGNSGTLAIEMMAAWLGGCKKRIVHSHNTKCDQVKADKLLRPVFNRLYTDALACGIEAGKWLYGNKPFIVLKNGRDINLYMYKPEIRKSMRKKYKLTNELVIGHVGGFFEQKNHIFLIKIFREILKEVPSAKLFLIGDGPLKNVIERSVTDISKNVIFVGTTNKISDYLQIFDGVILPSLFEGLPLVAIEWQINGLPCLFSDTITKECAVTDAVEYMSLKEKPSEWAREIESMICKHDRKKAAMDAIEKIRSAGFDINESCHILRDIYLN